MKPIGSLSAALTVVGAALMLLSAAALSAADRKPDSRPGPGTAPGNVQECPRHIADPDVCATPGKVPPGKDGGAGLKAKEQKQVTPEARDASRDLLESLVEKGSE
ncbi:hypothetical protein [Geomesophilobacter sediminis]|uniref:Uncharacterized protein n=1 Tax=Geomesophilobacter sediminis TaxID=2798584 RepID=A0A8J7JLM7_9BACT|nr:hypothetical protein [Geomesophilobacter sediminis]MBJ6725235.1 hypothetical protein [Geomesophilobacter sediminis]